MFYTQLNLRHKIEVVVLLCLYLMTAMYLSFTYYNGLDNDLFYRSLYPCFLLSISLLSMNFYQEKNKTRNLLIFSLSPFLIYFVLIIVLKDKYFVHTKLLNVVQVLFCIYQGFKFIRFGKAKLSEAPRV